MVTPLLHQKNESDTRRADTVMAVKKVPQTTVIRSRKSVHVLTGAYFTDP